MCVRFRPFQIRVARAGSSRLRGPPPNLEQTEAKYGNQISYRKATVRKPWRQPVAFV